MVAVVGGSSCRVRRESGASALQWCMQAHSSRTEHAFISRVISGVCGLAARLQSVFAGHSAPELSERGESALSLGVG